MRRWMAVWAVGTWAVLGVGCEETKPVAEPAKASSAPAASAAPAAVAKPSVSAAADEPPETKPSHPCPDGSKGDGTFKKPCLAKGPARAMEVKWTGKITDKGPSFSVTNKQKLEILYGHIFVYYYDKDKKQLALPGDDKSHKRQGCGGNIFAGPMKAGENAVIWFSCVPKDGVPEGAVSIEAELKTVGFTGSSGDKADTFWQNPDLAPEERPLGGVK